MKKVLIVGSKGMAGHVIYFYLKAIGEYEIRDISRTADHFSSSYLLDVSNTPALEKVLDEYAPDIVVNCIGVLNQDAEMHPDKSVLLNSYLPHFLAKAGDKRNFKLIHISTDCVFSGKKGDYTTADSKDGTGFYAETKALGEITYGAHVTLRTSIVGPEQKTNGIGLFDWFMKQQGNIKGYTNVIWTGITTLELARAVHKAIQQNLKGLYHVVNGSKISKYELLQLFKKIFERTQVVVEPYDLYSSDKSLVRDEEIFYVPSYENMLTGMKEWINQHKEIYPDYYQ